MKLSDLQGCDHRELTSVYQRPHPLVVPRGRYRGVHLAWIPQGPEALRWVQPALVLGFAWLPFGVDFDEQHWYFGHRALTIGRFRMDEGESRWRRGRALRLHYDVSRLPQFVTRWLYDEVKPIDAQLCLGIGGLNAPKGRGERFFFALVRA